MTQLLLLVGQCVQLQHLDISAYYSNANEATPVTFGALLNLAAASQLTRLELTNCWPDNLADGAWPSSMPMLKRLELLGSPSPPPAQMVNYSNLQHIQYDQRGYDFERYAIPDWLSQITQLKSLDLSGGAAVNFPICLLELSQLISLRLSYCSLLPAVITSFATWPNLIDLDLHCCGGTASADVVSIDTHLSLIELKEALGPRSWILTSNI